MRPVDGWQVAIQFGQPRVKKNASIGDPLSSFYCFVISSFLLVTCRCWYWRRQIRIAFCSADLDPVPFRFTGIALH